MLRLYAQCERLGNEGAVRIEGEAADGQLGSADTGIVECSACGLRYVLSVGEHRLARKGELILGDCPQCGD